MFLAAGSPIAPGQCEETLPKITAHKVAIISGKEVVRIFGTRTQFLRLCKAQHKRNYAESTIMRSRARVTRRSDQRSRDAVSLSSS
jgi:hypothetical protein